MNPDAQIHKYFENFFPHNLPSLFSIILVFLMERAIDFTRRIARRLRLLVS